MRVRATGSPRAHPLEVVGHGRRSPRFRNPLIGALRGTQHAIKRATLSRTRHRLQPFSTKGARCGADARFFSSWTAAVWSQATGRGFESPRRQAQAGSGGRCAKDRAQGLLAEGKKINLFSFHSQHTNTQTVTPSTRHSHLAHITPASFKCSQTCDAYRAHRHGSESPYPGSTPGLNPCNHLAR